MLIPKDARVVIAAQPLHETYYADPSVYNPARYINHPKLANQYANSPDYENRDHYAYGAGRRICVGIPLAERVQWSILARVLWGFRIEEGDVELDTDAYTDGRMCAPLSAAVCEWSSVGDVASDGWLATSMASLFLLGLSFILTLRIVTTEPLPFHVKFVPRSARHAEIVKRDFEQVTEFLAKWD